MDLFTIIDDANAIVRMPKGITKQTKLYQRGGRIFIPHGGGFVRLCAKFGDTFGTSHPDIKVEAIEGAGIVLDAKGQTASYRAPIRAAA